MAASLSTNRAGHLALIKTKYKTDFAVRNSRHLFTIPYSTEKFHVYAVYNRRRNSLKLLL
jgi:hypothetical protein